MPLPDNGTLSLQGHSKPGDALPSKPKQAMIVRMSAETLDALEMFPHQPPLQFAFGKNPVSDSFRYGMTGSLICTPVGYLHRGNILSNAPFEGGFTTRALPSLILRCKAHGASETLRERDGKIHS